MLLRRDPSPDPLSPPAPSHLLAHHSRASGWEGPASCPHLGRDDDTSGDDVATPSSPPARPVRHRTSGPWAKLSIGALWLPFPALLWIEGYAGAEPRLFGLPFFYWYQFLWIFLSSSLTWCAYLHTTPTRQARTGAHRPAGPGERSR
ncbi:DUF3311 domain-containing protein [Nonomuraea spiralis]|uniref:DUF3311 domain-containing protein n=1 Tax=Nonomuraea spiralis TaxID=46182 RepID=UPI003899074D